MWNKFFASDSTTYTKKFAPLPFLYSIFCTILLVKISGPDTNTFVQIASSVVLIPYAHQFAMRANELRRDIQRYNLGAGIWYPPSRRSLYIVFSRRLCYRIHKIFSCSFLPYYLNRKIFYSILIKHNFFIVKIFDNMLSLSELYPLIVFTMVNIY